MRLLAIETATSACSVALIDDGAVVDHAHVAVGRGHAEALLPMIARLAGGGRADAICVDVGPGSFTGVRVGVAAARALGFGWRVPVTGFGSLALIAARDGTPDVCVAIEGGHGELFVARYAGPLSEEVEPPRSLPFDVAVGTLTAERVVGNAAARLVAARGWGSAAEVDPDARGVALLDRRHRTLPPLPHYLRAADAKPMA